MVGRKKEAANWLGGALEILALGASIWQSFLRKLITSNFNVLHSHEE